jgi:hypothetical protein
MCSILFCVSVKLNEIYTTVKHKIYYDNITVLKEATCVWLNDVSRNMSPL